ncbi:cell division protein ZapA [Rubrivirga sp.]|uniref:cell division protein ZapA n=1 Tax=Rubrivirga sp. TaxID=1885344 RepID=UPI003C75D812
MSAPVSIRVRILDRDYPLRVAPGDEDYTIHLAARVDERIRRLRHDLPTQPDLTHVVLTALELAEELYAARAETDRLRARLEIESGALADRLDAALSAGGDGAPQPTDDEPGP